MDVVGRSSNNRRNLHARILQPCEPPLIFCAWLIAAVSGHVPPAWSVPRDIVARSPARPQPHHCSTALASPSPRHNNTSSPNTAAPLKAVPTSRQGVRRVQVRQQESKITSASACLQISVKLRAASRRLTRVRPLGLLFSFAFALADPACVPPPPHLSPHATLSLPCPASAAAPAPPLPASPKPLPPLPPPSPRWTSSLL